jgi:hypothetical protein
MKLSLAAALLLACACGRSSPDRGASVDYRPPDNSFQARLPSDWKADETPGETRKAAFFGPPGGAKPYSQLMGIYFHKAADPEDAARAYLSGNGPAALKDVVVGSRRAIESTVTRTTPGLDAAPEAVLVRTVAVTVPGGFYVLEATWPVGAAADPAFGELLRTFEPSAGAPK